MGSQISVTVFRRICSTLGSEELMLYEVFGPWEVLLSSAASPGRMTPARPRAGRWVLAVYFLEVPPNSLALFSSRPSSLRRIFQFQPYLEVPGRSVWPLSLFRSAWCHEVQLCIPSSQPGFSRYPLHSLGECGKDLSSIEFSLQWAWVLPSEYPDPTFVGCVHVMHGQGGHCSPLPIKSIQISQPQSQCIYHKPTQFEDI